MDSSNKFESTFKKTTPGEIKSLPGSEEIVKLLECPCCLEPPIPPIKTCVTGHIICSFCRPRLTRCAICREPYTDCRNYPLETIFNGCTIACKFWGRGCQEIVTGDKFVDHVKICQFRTLCCSHCQECISPVDKYVEHLKEKHNAFGYDQEEAVYLYHNSVSDLHSDHRFPDQYAAFDGKYFIVSAQIRNQFMHIWLSIVENLSIPEQTLSGNGGSEGQEADPSPDETCSLAEMKRRAEQSHYNAVISLSPENHPIPHAEWAIPIYPLQNGDPDPALVVNIPMYPTFRAFLTKVRQDANENEVRESKYTWSFTYTISRELGPE